MKARYINAYMDVAERFAELSYAERLHVGAIVVKDDRIISIGYNGTPSGWDNVCEEKVYMPVSAGGWLDADMIDKQYPHEDETGRYKTVTKAEVLHAESNCISKLARSPESGLGAVMFITHSPCIECAKLIYQSGIAKVYYKHTYRSDSGIRFLEKSGVIVIQVPH